ncbi:MAG: transcriptional repressor [Oscillospiraceae bacterium]
MGMTKQRHAILEIVRASKGHPTAEQVFEKARVLLPNISLDTVYRNLNLLADGGKLERLTIPGETVRFGANTLPHSHLRCVKCGKIMDVMVQEFELPEAFLGKGATILDYSLLANCICKDCAQKAAAAKNRGK